MPRRLVSRRGTVSAAKMIHARVKKQNVAYIEVGWNGCRRQRHLRVYWGGITILDPDGGTATHLLNTTSSIHQWLVTRSNIGTLLVRDDNRVVLPATICSIGTPDTGAAVAVGIAGVISRGVWRGAKYQVGAGGHGSIKLVRVVST